MQDSFFLGLVQNIALLLTFSMLYDYFWARADKNINITFKIGSGLFLGGLGIILMLTPWTFGEGLIFDTRSVLLSTAGLFLGPIPTILAILVLSVYRFIIGGPGVAMGLTVIVSSGVLGILWRYFRVRWNKDRISVSELVILGLIVHIVMLISTLLLPGAARKEVLLTIILPLLLIYPTANVLLGLLMLRQRQNWENKKALDVSEERWRFALEGSGDGLWDWNVKTGEVFYSRQWKAMLGYEDHELGNTLDTWKSVVHPDDMEITLESLNLMLNGEVEVYEAEHRLKCKDGSYIWVSDMGKAISRDKDGKPLRCLGTHRDITRRKEYEESIDSSRKQLKSFAAHLQDVREEERIMLAREIHDELGQILVAIKIDLGMLMQKVNTIPSVIENTEIKSSFDRLLELVNNTIKTSRKIMTDLRPEVLHTLGFVEAVRLYIRNFEGRFKIRCSFNTNASDLTLSLQQSLALYRILQEALSNVARHSRATRVEIELDVQPEHISLQIRDNGIGMEVNKMGRIDSYGLIGMRERVSLLEGTLQIDGSEGKGTIIRIKFPHMESNHVKLETN